MPIFKDSYQTTVGSAFVTKSIETAVKSAFIRDGLHHTNLGVRRSGNVSPVFVIGSWSSEADIPLFTHPIVVLNHDKEKFLCTDLRFYVKKGTPASEIESGIRNLTEYNFAKSRAILNLLWVSERVGEIRNGLRFAGAMYATWLSDAIGKTYALDHGDKQTVAIIAHFFYQALFSEETTFDEEAKQIMAAHTIKATFSTADQVFKVLDKLPPLKDITDFCKAVAELVENVRVKDFNLAALLTMVSNSWYGTNSREIISVALEHPPTWLAIVYTGLTERTYKTSAIARIGEMLGKRGVGDEFIKHYQLLMRENTVEQKPGLVISNEEIIAELGEFK